ncbi:hypothetical protein O3P69_014793 [Scylla paramamosain]|uniref:Uncharacterized protein n=1 Tax=Scylla paramamosain TaxID=85552 RepID=A0AAW0TZY0_SCYPA
MCTGLKHSDDSVHWADPALAAELGPSRTRTTSTGMTASGEATHPSTPCPELEVPVPGGPLSEASREGALSLNHSSPSPSVLLVVGAPLGHRRHRSPRSGPSRRGHVSRDGARPDLKSEIRAEVKDALLALLPEFKASLASQAPPQASPALPSVPLQGNASPAVVPSTPSQLEPEPRPGSSGEPLERDALSFRGASPLTPLPSPGEHMQEEEGDADLVPYHWTVLPPSWCHQFEQGKIVAFSPDLSSPLGWKRRDDVQIKFATSDEGVTIFKYRLKPWSASEPTPSATKISTTATFDAVRAILVNRLLNPSQTYSVNTAYGLAMVEFGPLRRYSVNTAYGVAMVEFGPASFFPDPGQKSLDVASMLEKAVDHGRSSARHPTIHSSQPSLLQPGRTPG